MAKHRFVYLWKKSELLSFMTFGVEPRAYAKGGLGLNPPHDTPVELDILQNLYCLHKEN